MECTIVDVSEIWHAVTNSYNSSCSINKVAYVCGVNMVTVHDIMTTRITE